MTEHKLRALPSVERLVRAVEQRAPLPRPELVRLARETIDELRSHTPPGAELPSLEQLAADVLRRAAALAAPGLRPLINATGVVVQTNLGRAPLSEAALAAMQVVAAGYSNLEYNLEAGERGSRYEHVGALLARLTGAEAAVAVNNNAAAVLLALSCFCQGKEVLVSRGQAVEIGGGFRIPDVLRESGARLVEVGTTNRTYARDYAAAIGPDTAAILTVHRSNFRIVGFTHDPHEMELHHLAHEGGILWIDDWGSGSLLRPERWGLAADDTVLDRVAAGCDLVCFSGDKLLGGPQAGLIVGRSEYIDRLRKHPLLRALRVDKLAIAALEATLLSYLHGRAEHELPVWRMIGTPVAALQVRAAALAQRIQAAGCAAEIVEVDSAVGGGSLPGETLPSVALALQGRAEGSTSLPGRPEALHASLRSGAPPVVGRIAGGRLLLDLRTVLPEQDELLINALIAALK